MQNNTLKITLKKCANLCTNQALRPPRSGASADRRIFLFSFPQYGGFLPKAATPLLPVVATLLPEMLPL